jgi:hypothetical protein
MLLGGVEYMEVETDPETEESPEKREESRKIGF